MNVDADLCISTFGPCRAIGISCMFDTNSNEIASLWHRFCARTDEIGRIEPNTGFGLCYWYDNPPDGRGEYIASIMARPGSTVPNGMIAVDLPQCKYAAFNVLQVSQVRDLWRMSFEVIRASSNWKPSPAPVGRAACVSFGFEYYPPSFAQDGEFSIYIPVSPRPRRSGASHAQGAATK
jgi:predicted transcriptional regulator YdeE